MLQLHQPRRIDRPAAPVTRGALRHLVLTTLLRLGRISPAINVRVDTGSSSLWGVRKGCNVEIITELKYYGVIIIL